MTFEEIEREAAELIRKFPDWHPDDRQAIVQQVLCQTLAKGVKMEQDRARLAGEPYNPGTGSITENLQVDII